MNLSTEELKRDIYNLPFIVQYANGSEIKISESLNDTKEISYVTKAKWKKRTVDIEFCSVIDDKEMTDIKTPWRVFEINDSR